MPQSHDPNRINGGGLSRIDTPLFDAPARIWLRLLAVILPALFVAGVVFQPWFEPRWAFMDPIAAAEAAPQCCRSHYGFVSNLGIMMWAGTAAICLLAAGLLALDRHSRTGTRFALAAGLFTGWLAIDDALLIHESVLPHAGVPQHYVLSAYIVLVVIYCLTAFRTILRSDRMLFVLALLFLGGSMALDLAFHSLPGRGAPLEDGLKFIGISCWAVFHVATAFALLAGQLRYVEARGRFRLMIGRSGGRAYAGGLMPDVRVRA